MPSIMVCLVLFEFGLYFGLFMNNFYAQLQPLINK